MWPVLHCLPRSSDQRPLFIFKRHNLGAPKLSAKSGDKPNFDSSRRLSKFPINYDKDGPRKNEAHENRSRETPTSSINRRLASPISRRRPGSPPAGPSQPTCLSSANSSTVLSLRPNRRLPHSKATHPANTPLVTVLLLNAMCIPSEDRFLARGTLCPSFPLAQLDPGRRKESHC